MSMDSSVRLPKRVDFTDDYNVEDHQTSTAVDLTTALTTRHAAYNAEIVEANRSAVSGAANGRRSSHQQEQQHQHKSADDDLDDNGGVAVFPGTGPNTRRVKSRPRPRPRPRPMPHPPKLVVEFSDDRSGDDAFEHEEDEGGHDGSSSINPDTPTSHSLSVTSSPSPGGKKNDLRFMQGGDVPSTAASFIEESDRELVSQDGYPLSIDSQITSQGDHQATLAPIKGTGIPNLGSPPPLPTGPGSVITDRGEELYEDLKKQGRTSSFPLKEPTESGDDHDTALADRIFDAQRMTYCPNRGTQSREILARGQLDQLITEAAVCRELLRSEPIRKAHGDECMPRFAKRICREVQLTGDDFTKPRTKSFKKIFAVLVLIDMADYILRFLEEDVSDVDLPLQVVYPKESSKAFHLRRKRDPDTVLTCFQGWKQINIRNFERYQWSFLAPFFAKGPRKNPPHYVLPDQIILPYIFDASPDSGRDAAWSQTQEGGQSEVFKVYIHPEHHNFHDDNLPGNCFAVRRKKSTSRAEFTKEVEVLKKFSGDYHQHLVDLLATYEHLGQYFLLFKWAESDLDRFWKANPTPTLEQETVTWIATQCAGIAEALHRIHIYRDSLRARNDSKEYVYGRHGDIKPENVLFFRNPDDPKDRGTLKLADFGLSEFRTVASKSKVPRSEVGSTLAYRPPEIDMPGCAISRSYDIWTLGCVYLEFVVWAVGGYTLCKRFAHKRLTQNLLNPEFRVPEFFDIKNGIASVKTVVTQYFRKLHKDKKCPGFFHEFLTTIEEEMVIVEQPGESGVKRITSAELNAKLKKMCNRCTGAADGDPYISCKRSST